MDNEVMQENHYYPFGLNHEGPFQPVQPVENAYQYNGKELNEEFGLGWQDFGFRWYDPAIARFPSVDPIIEKFPYLTPYNYASNDPIRNIDLWGLQGTSYDIRFNNRVKRFHKGEISQQEFIDEGVAEAKGAFMGIGGLGLGALLKRSIVGLYTWAISNPVTIVNGIRNVGMSVSEALTEQQLGVWGGAAIVGGKTIKRVGKYTPDIMEININTLAFWHKVPRSNLDEPLEHIDDLVKIFQNEGFDLAKAPHVIEVNGHFIISDGMHRTAAMLRAGEETIPSRVYKWEDFPDALKDDFLNTDGLGGVIKQALDN